MEQFQQIHYKSLVLVVTCTESLDNALRICITFHNFKKLTKWYPWSISISVSIEFIGITVGNISKYQ